MHRFMALGEPETADKDDRGQRHKFSHIARIGDCGRLESDTNFYSTSGI